MAQPFTHTADSLQSFFSQPGRGFYVPFYQRAYSWDEENGAKLANDIFSAVKRTLTKPDNSVFLGTVILHDEKNVAHGVHTDTPNLLTKVSNVVDGQQRITSLAMLACVLGEYIGKYESALQAISGGSPEVPALANDLANELPQIQEFFAVHVRRNGAQPPLKPIIIRAGDVSKNPVSDQWTLQGNIANFYVSNTSNYLANAINGVPLASIAMDDRIKGVVQAFREVLDDELDKADPTLATGLAASNADKDSTLYKFMSYQPNLANVLALTPDEQKTYFAGLLLLAACAFIKNGCYFVVIECLDEGLAFDMFQSLNATGTPLTAFEVFKPTIVMTWAAAYATTIKSQVDRIEQVFNQESSATKKVDVTDRVICSTALAYSGEVIGERFSEERDWLIKTLQPAVPSPQLTMFVTSLADQAEYQDKFVRPRRPNKGLSNFALVNHLQSLGMPLPDADLAALCVYYLRDAKHVMAHSVVSVFYANLLHAQGNPAAVTLAASELLAVCKAVASFFTLWMGGSPGRFPDAAYRQMFQASGGNMSIANGAANQTSVWVKGALRNALAGQGAYDASSAALARVSWVAQAKGVSWYQRKAVCRFGLFAAFHDAAVDLRPGSEGLSVNGMANCAPMLSCQAWHAPQYEVIEHVATRDKPNVIKFPTHHDAAVYPGNYSIVDKIGNLALLSVPVNSSVYSEWPDKAFYYWSLTTPSSVSTGPLASALIASLGLATIPPSLSSLVAASVYLPHLAPLAQRGIAGLHWDAGFIDSRSEHLCGRIFDVLDGWLR